MVMCDCVVCSHTHCCQSFVLNVRVDRASSVVHGQIGSSANEVHVAVIAMYIHGSVYQDFSGCL